MHFIVSILLDDGAVVLSQVERTCEIGFVESETQRDDHSSTQRLEAFIQNSGIFSLQ